MSATRSDCRVVSRSIRRTRLQELLIEKPLLDPDEYCVVVLHGNHHRGLADDPVPQLLRDRSKIRAHRANRHEEQSARGKLVLAAKRVFEKFDHVVRELFRGHDFEFALSIGNEWKPLAHLRFFHVLLPRSRSTTTLCMSVRIAYKILSKVSRRTPVLIEVALAGEQRKESRLCSPGTLCFGTTPPSLETYTSAGYAYLLVVWCEVSLLFTTGETLLSTIALRG